MREHLSLTLTCPFCPWNKDDYVHLLGCWVIGTNVFACDGQDIIEDKSLLKLFPELQTGRGSKIIIFYWSEFCQHYWFKAQQFHKGQTFETVHGLTLDELKKLGIIEYGSHKMEMWRD